LASESPDSNTQIQRYIRLTYLLPEILQMVDEGKIALRPAVEISYLNDIEQLDLVEAMDLAMATPSHAQAIKMRNFSGWQAHAGGHRVHHVRGKAQPERKDQYPLEDARRYIPPVFPMDKTGEFILKALEYYHRHLERQREDAR
jgi:ParB family chromosome partitioning protein